MIPTRRQLLGGSALTLFGSGFGSRLDKVVAMQKGAAASLADTLKHQSNGPSQSLLLKPLAGAEGPPAPADFDRLPLDWLMRRAGPRTSPGARHSV